MKLKVYILLIISLCYAYSIKAQKASGAEIFYERIDSLKYLVIANVYRKCNTDSLSSVKAYLQIQNKTELIDLRRISIENVSDTCGNPCNIQNKNSNFGFEKHTWIDTVNLNQSKYLSVINGNCMIAFRLEIAVDNELNFYNTTKSIVECQINLCHTLGNYKSPQFNIRPKFMAKLNQAYIHNPGIVKDNEDDSLGFSLEMPLFYEDFFNNPPPNINFTPYCPAIPGSTSCRPQPNARPPSGFYFDNVTSDVIFTPTVNNQNGILTIVCHLYRKDLTSNQPFLLGSVMREYILYVRDLGNNSPPYFTSSNRYTKCKDLDLILNLPSNDDNTSDTIKLDWNNSSNNISFKIVNDTLREKTAQVKLSSSSNVKMTQDYFALIAHDGNCHSETSRGYVVTSLPNPRIANFSKDLKGCNQYIVDFDDTISNNFTTTLQYKYELVLLSDTSIRFVGTKNLDTIKYKKRGDYVLKLWIKNNYSQCESMHVDTINLQSVYLLENLKNDTAICLNETIELGNNLFKDSSTQFKWEYPIGTILLDSSSSIILSNKQLKSKVKLNIENEYCNNSIELELKSEYNFDVSIVDTLVCKNQMVNIGLLNVLKNPTDTISWLINGNAFTNPLNFLLIKADSLTQIQVILKHKRCEMLKTININTLELPEFAFSDSVFCKNNTYSIKPKMKDTSLQSYQFLWKLDEVVINQSSDSLEWQFSNESKLSLGVQNASGCLYNKELNLYYYENPNFSFSDSVFCPQSISTISILPEFNSGTNLSYYWFLDDTLINHQFNTLTTNFDNNNQIKMKVTDQTKCYTEKTIQVQFYTIPYFEFDVQQGCKDSNATIRVISLNDIQSYQWFINENSVLNDISSLNFALKNEDKIRLQIRDINQCSFHDSIIYFSFPEPNFNILGDTVYWIDDTVKLTVNNTFSSYWWNNGSDEKSNIFNAKDLSGIGFFDISCRVIDSNQCIGFQSKNIEIKEKTNLIANPIEQFKIYPIPTQSKLYIESKTLNKCVLLDIFGRVVLNFELNTGLNEIDIHFLKSGIYVLKINNELYKIQISD